MKVYILIGLVDYEGETVIAVLSSQEKAAALRDKAQDFKRDYDLVENKVGDDSVVNKWLKKNKPPIAGRHVQYFDSFRVEPFDLI